MKFISTKDAPQAIGPYSQAVEANGMIYTSGQIGLTPEGVFASTDVAGQMDQVMKNLTAVLDASGVTLNEVIKTTIFLADMNDFAIVNDIYASYFGTHRPVRSTVAVKTLPANALVEIDCVALTVGLTGGDYSY